MRLNGFSLARYEPGDELEGGWSREQLVEMDTLFIARVEEAFACGLENRASAAAQVRLPTNSARFVAPLCPATQDGLFRSAENALVFVARSARG
jgi:hypothetical protein